MHTDKGFAQSGRFRAPVVHGMFYASMFGAIVSKRHPGAVYASQSLDFKRPVMLGDTVTATVTLLSIGPSGRILHFQTVCSNQRGEIVLSGDARVMLPKRPKHGEGATQQTSVCSASQTCDSNPACSVS
eukprot:3246077-Pleurochrysis_carterae.AAC.3